MTPEAKLERLRELVNVWVKYLDLWEDVSVELVTRTEKNNTHVIKMTDEYGRERDTIHTVVEKVPPTPFVVIKWYNAKGKWKGILHPTGYESREFPLEDIDRRIEHYRYKIKTKQDE